ncbi:MAG: LURP-one-related family protein [Candidatus Freyarchaeota archaeon]|nr:LURP-one-related family protein [Candidatus Jordarchaeia archaeon]
MGLLDYETYIIDEKLLVLRNTLIIRSEREEEIGRAVAKFPFSWREMKLYDAGGNLVGIVKEKFLSLRGIYTLHDYTGYHIATVKEKLFTLRPMYWIEDRRGNVIYNLKGDVLRRKFEVKDADEKTVARATRKLLSLKDNYKLELLGMNPLLALLTVIAVHMNILRHRATA